VNASLEDWSLLSSASAVGVVYAVCASN
jgi:hypothetical protein